MSNARSDKHLLFPLVLRVDSTPERPVSACAFAVHPLPAAVVRDLYLLEKTVEVADRGVQKCVRHSCSNASFWAIGISSRLRFTSNFRTSLFTCCFTVRGPIPS